MLIWVLIIQITAMMKNNVLDYQKEEAIGSVNSVDTGLAIAIIKDDVVLSQLQVNQLLAVQSPKSGRFIIAMIIKIYRKASSLDLDEVEEDELNVAAFNQVKLVFVGEFIDKVTMEEYIEMCSKFGSQAGMTNEEMKAIELEDFALILHLIFVMILFSFEVDLLKIFLVLMNSHIP